MKSTLQNLEKDVAQVRRLQKSDIENVDKILKATTKSIQETTTAILTPLTKRQDNFEVTTNSQFDSLLGQLADVHVNPSKTLCDVCKKMFENERSLQKHIRSCHHHNQT